jgi:hypothetical protein
VINGLVERGVDVLYILMASYEMRAKLALPLKQGAVITQSREGSSGFHGRNIVGKDIHIHGSDRDKLTVSYLASRKYSYILMPVPFLTPINAAALTKHSYLRISAQSAGRPRAGSEAVRQKLYLPMRHIPSCPVL